MNQMGSKTTATYFFIESRITSVRMKSTAGIAQKENPARQRRFVKVIFFSKDIFKRLCFFNVRNKIFI